MLYRLVYKSGAGIFCLQPFHLVASRDLSLSNYHPHVINDTKLPFISDEHDESHGLSQQNSNRARL